MSESTDSNPHRLFLERIEATKDRDAADEVTTWRHATDDQKSRAIIELARLGANIVRWRGFPDDRPPLAYPLLRRIT